MSEELKALEAEAAAVDASVAPVAAEQTAAAEQQQQVDRVAEAGLIVGFLRPALEIGIPYVKGAPDLEWDALRAPVAELLEFYNFDMAKYLSSPWAKLGMAGMPLLLRGFTNWKAESEKAGAEKPQAIAAPEVSAPVPLDQPQVMARG